MLKAEIILQLDTQFKILENLMANHSATEMLQKDDNNDWSIADNIQHLILATKPLAFLFKRPEIMSQTWGESNRTSREFSEIERLYLKRIGVPGFTTKDYTPSNNEINIDDLVENFKATNEKLLLRTQSLTEAELDAYQIPHPLIGLMTCKEFLYFTLYHTVHHIKTIKKILRTQ